jgi:hypothetical protein
MGAPDSAPVPPESVAPPEPLLLLDDELDELPPLLEPEPLLDELVPPLDPPPLVLEEPVAPPLDEPPFELLDPPDDPPLAPPLEPPPPSPPDRKPGSDWPPEHAATAEIQAMPVASHRTRVATPSFTPPR